MHRVTLILLYAQRDLLRRALNDLIHHLGETPLVNELTQPTPDRDQRLLRAIRGQVIWAAESIAESDPFSIVLGERQVELLDQAIRLYHQHLRATLPTYNPVIAETGVVVSLIDRALTDRQSLGIVPHLCDYCGCSVAPQEDAALLRRLLYLANEDLLSPFEVPDRNASRHLFPSATCPGSPSTAQYLEGQPRDPRYPYKSTYEAPSRAAYAQMQEG